MTEAESSHFKLWGTRGSIPKTGADSVIYGGSTSCYEISQNQRTIIFDAGTGIIGLGQELLQQRPKQIDLFFTHYHFDHVAGLPFFAPLFDPRFSIRIFADDQQFSRSAKDVLEQLFSQPFFPVGLEAAQANITFHDLSRRKVVKIDTDFTIDYMPLSHPGGNTAYRSKIGGKTIVYSGDFTHGDAQKDQQLSEWVDGANIAILECTYTPEDYETRKNHGHTHWKAVGEIAKGAQRWFGVHHNHLSTDDELAEIDRQINQTFPNGHLGRDGMNFEI